jgi:hypothetical protein
MTKVKGIAMRKIVIVASAVVLAVVAVLLAGCGGLAGSGAAGSGAATATQSPTAFVPADFVTFAKALQAQSGSEPTTGTAWYPKYLPAGFKLASIETTVLAPGSGPVCDVIFASGTAQIYLSEGSPVMRDYEIVPLETVPWGTASASRMDNDGEPGGDQSIVYTDPRDMGELSGDVSMDELKKIAASMVTVP